MTAKWADEIVAYGGLAEGDKAAQETVKPLPFWEATNRARLLQFVELGGDLGDLELDSKTAKGMPRHERIRLGKKRRRVNYRLPGQEDIRGLARARQRRDIQDQRDTFRELQDSPFFDALMGDAQGTTSRFAQSIQQLGRQTLGGAAVGGLNLRDPGVQARLLGPNAFQGMMAQRQLQRQAGATGQALTRGPGSTVGMTAPRGLGQLQGLVFQQFGANLQAQQFNKGLKAQVHTLQAGQRMAGAAELREGIASIWGQQGGDAGGQYTQGGGGGGYSSSGSNNGQYAQSGYDYGGSSFSY